jgi:hypothetical protein
MDFAIAIPQTFADPVRIQRFLKRADELPFVAVLVHRAGHRNCSGLGVCDNADICSRAYATVIGIKRNVVRRVCDLIERYVIE